MVFASARYYAWDFCLAPVPSAAGERYQLFYLREERRDPPFIACRRAAFPLADYGPISAIGRAGSADLITWRQGPAALCAGQPDTWRSGPWSDGAWWGDPAWDTGAVWPGCVVERGGTYYLFYTGSRPTAAGPWRRVATDLQIGLATSSNLEDWTRHPANPLLADALIPADAAHAERPAGQVGWRDRQQHSDPWVVSAPDEGAYYLFFVAGGENEPSWARGVVGCARSADLVTWQALGPVTEPGICGDLRALQVIPLDGHWYLLFSTVRPRGPQQRRTWPSGDWEGTGYLLADRLTGPYRLLDDAPLLAAPYTGARVAAAPDGRPVVLAIRDRDDTGRDLGVLADPAPLEVGRDGRLRVEVARLWPAGWRLTNEFDTVPPAFVERGLAHGLLSVEQALALAADASAEPAFGAAAIPRVEYLVAILDGAALDEARRAALERVALEVALAGRRHAGQLPSPDLASLALLLPRLTGARRAEAGERALACALPKSTIRSQLLAPLAPWLSRDELSQALDLVAGPDTGDPEITAGWEDDPELDTWDFVYDDLMALIPHLSGRERRRALVQALLRAGRLASDSETFGRSLGPREAALAELAPYLVDDDLQMLARAIARASGLAPPPDLDWPVEGPFREYLAVARRAFLAEVGWRRWLDWHDRTTTAILTDLPAADRDRLVAEALDCLWHHRYLPGDEAVFFSRGLRGAARFLTRERVAEQFRLFGRRWDAPAALPEPGSPPEGVPSVADDA